MFTDCSSGDRKFVVDMMNVILGIIVSLGCCSLICSEATNPVISMMSPEVELVKPFTFNCTVTGDLQWGNISFLRNDEEICKVILSNSTCYKDKISQQGYLCQCVSQTDYSITTDLYAISFAGNWSCSSQHLSGNYTSNTITIYSMNPWLRKVTSRAEMNQSFTFGCIAANEMQWGAISFMRDRQEICKLYYTKDGDCNIIVPAMEGYTCSCDSTEDSNQNYNMTINSFGKSSAKTWSCQGVHSGLTYKSFPLTLCCYWVMSGPCSALMYSLFLVATLDEPERVTVTGNQANFTADGDKLYLNCTSHLTNCQVNFMWINETSNAAINSTGQTYTETDTDGFTYTNTLTISPSWYQDGDNITCKVTDKNRYKPRNVSSSITLDLIYAPYVKVYSETSPENKTLRLICEASGRPASYVFSTFSHSWEGEKIRELTGTFLSPNKYELTIHPYSHNDSGVYQCTVSNNITGINNSKLQTANTTVTVNIEVEPANDNQTLIAIVCGVVAAVVLLVIIGVVVYLIKKRRKYSSDINMK